MIIQVDSIMRLGRPIPESGFSGLNCWLVQFPDTQMYTGLYLRFVRTYTYIMEFIHKASYADRWNPWKVSRVVKNDHL
ncbi:hypothetical protein A3196_09995 [Candidatus Thiodiazotropha endoloripes]|uniref:Uncharacterized protein n=1 Tax=Candidatus Thiodiazotropha endoloripes TaxID=1818881 RepID=A0A1E2UQQ4_9GAMM|nr:hypothetical protein A3196_09995 [Candidatus Thiodiazotropha endoloripes]